jgi:hypothetical protein
MRAAEDSGGSFLHKQFVLGVVQESSANLCHLTEWTEWTECTVARSAWCQTGTRCRHGSTGAHLRNEKWFAFYRRCDRCMCGRALDCPNTCMLLIQKPVSSHASR